MNANRIVISALLAALLSCMEGEVTPILAGESPVGENLALGRTCRLFPAPNYRYCTDPDDARQLTDGQTTDQYFWTQKGTVGWQHARYATVTVDLGRIEPIGGVSLTTAAGVAGVTWPIAVQILVSDDGRTFHDAGDLVGLDRESHGPWPQGYAIRQLQTDRLSARGRFVQFVLIPMAGGPYLFTDEIQVFRGPATLLDQQADPATETDARRVYEQGRLTRSLRHRWQADLDSLDKAIARSQLDADAREELLQRLETLRKAGPDQVATDASRRMTLPLGERHAQLFAIQAALWHATGLGDLTAWTANPWDPLDPFATPPVSSDAALTIDAMRGEFRSAAFNLANSTDQPLVVRLSFQSIPGAPAPDGVTLHEVAWTDTSQGVPIAAALPEAIRDGDAWQVTVWPGLVRQVWISFHPSSEEPGRYAGRLVIESGALKTRHVPLTLRVWPFEMPQEKSLWLGGWSYTDSDGRYGMTQQNRSAFVRHLQDHDVNAPWASSGVLMSFEFDRQDLTKIQLDTKALDRWIDRWPNAKAYLVFLSVAHYSGAIRSSLGGADIDSPEFQQRVGTWISAWVKHLRSRGIEPNRLGLLIHDEPHEGSDVGPLLAWARAIQAAEPDVIIWEDPTYRDPAAAPTELFDVCDVLCPNRPMWL
ncbi:MAG: hypothetical protein JJ992_15690, partial [Planctomycetes bacterium]|nr:hypothetical protein [Planctomycetota bacterium]